MPLENPAGFERLNPVTTMGLLCFEPTEMMALKNGDVAYRATPTWIPVARDDKEFLQFLAVVSEILELASPPKPRARCEWCSRTAA